jgi:multidrug efflux pump subunit AcrA (membrane-fusion protein)
MNRFRQMVAGVVLATCVVAQAQSGTDQPPAKPVRTKVAKTKTKAPTQEEILLEQLNEKFQKLDQVNSKLNDLEQKYEALQQRMAARDAELEQARKDAADAKQKLEATQAIIGTDGSTVTTLQGDVATLKTTSSSLSTQVQASQEETKKLENPDMIHFMGIGLKPGGFLAAETVDRQRAIGGDVNTQFTGIPFAGTTAGELSEFNASGRQSRISLLAEGKIPAATLRGYFEADFLSAGTTSNDNQSNSYPLRLRQAWAQAELNNGWILTGGQMWSLATEYRHGLENNSEAIPLTIDSQYNVGFTWERQYGFRVVKRISNKFWIGGAVEESQTLNIGGHNLPTIAYQQTGNGGGLYNSTANYSFNEAPDLIAKAAYETNWGHFELFGISRFFRDRVFPNGPAPTGAAQPVTTSALGAYTTKADGGGVGANARVWLFAKKLEIDGHILAGNGIGRYSSAQLPDATAHPDGSLELLSGGSALGSVEWHATPRLDLYGYYGGEYAKRAWYNTGYTVTTAGPTLGQPILGGYGAPTNNVAGCYVEVLPVTSPNGGGNVASSPSNCNADNRNIQEGTFGYWFRFYRGSRGTLQQGIQYSYAERRTWQGIGNPAAGLTNSPKAIDNMWFTSIRYYLPK